MLTDLIALESGQGAMGMACLVLDVWVLVGPQLGISSSGGLEDQLSQCGFFSPSPAAWPAWLECWA